MNDPTDPAASTPGSNDPARLDAAGPAGAAETGPPPPGTGPPADLTQPARGGDGAPVGRQSETTVWTGRTSWRHYIGRLALAAIVYVGVVVVLWWVSGRFEWSTLRLLTAAGVALLVVCGVMFVWVLLVVLDRRYRLTEQRLFIERGVLSKTIDQTELVRVDDVRVRKSLMDRVFGLGTVEVISTDSTDRSVSIEGVEGSDEIAEHIRDHMRQLRKQSLFIENL